MSSVTERSKFIQISEADFCAGGRNLDEKLSTAACKGFFYLEIPEKCKPFLKAGVEFNKSFYTNSELKGLKLEGFSGYKDRETLQLESFYLSKKYWKELLPVEVQELAKQMHQLGIATLKKTLTLCNISEEDQAHLSGKATAEGGSIHFTFNHYRSEKECAGGAEHRDFGQITVLFIDQAGLQAKIDGNWVDVPPLEGHFVINYGRSLETSINNPSQLTAAWHRVQRVFKDRISFGVFIDNEMNSQIFQRTQEGKIVDTGDSFEAYIKKCFAERPK